MVKINYVMSDRIVSLLADFVEYAALLESRSEHAQQGKMPALDVEYNVDMATALLSLTGGEPDRSEISDMYHGAVPESVEVRNLRTLRQSIDKKNPLSLQDLAECHAVLMKDLTTEEGMYRRKGSPVPARDCFVRVLTPSSTVPGLMEELCEWYHKSEAHPLVKAVIFFYCFQMIHPFADGNQRLGLIWMRLLLSRWKKFFLYIPIETYILRRRKEYQNIMSASSGDCSRLVEFMMRVFYCALEDYEGHLSHRQNATESMNRLLDLMEDDKTYTNRELMEMVGIKHRPTFRDNYLLPCISAGLVVMTVPNKPNSKNQRYRKTTA